MIKFNKLLYPASFDQYHAKFEEQKHLLSDPQLNPAFCLHSQSDEQVPSAFENAILSVY